VFAALADLDAPAIHFGVDTGELLAAFAAAGPDVVGVDWRTRLDVARSRVGASGRALGVQGNLDPAAVLAPWEVVEGKVRDVVEANAGRPGHVFNLGHGVLPESDPAVLARITDLVHEITAASR
jgi:uroporphyrinogen decarboxylase